MNDIQNYRIVWIDPAKDHAVKTLVQHECLIWPDSYSISDGYLYVSCSQIHKQPEYNDGIDMRTTPYTIYRIKL